MKKVDYDWQAALVCSLSSEPGSPPNPKLLCAARFRLIQFHLVSYLLERQPALRSSCGFQSAFNRTCSGFVRLSMLLYLYLCYCTFIDVTVRLSMLLYVYRCYCTFIDATVRLSVLLYVYLCYCTLSAVTLRLSMLLYVYRCKMFFGGTSFWRDFNSERREFPCGGVVSHILY